jgi:hypothetical protein
MIKPVNISTLVDKPVSKLQKHLSESYYDSEEYKTEVVIEGAIVLYSPCGMFIYLYNESKDTLILILEQGLSN